MSEVPDQDHRRLGRQLGIFASDDEVGAGLPLWLPAGATIRRQLEDYVVALERRAGYQHVYTPPLAKRSLFERSGHWKYFRSEMFPPMKSGGDELVLRPVNCPHHCRVYAAAERSYRDLPLRLAELGQMFRREKSGVLGGLARVRCMTLNDAHIFCTPDQVGEELGAVLDLVAEAHAALGITLHRLRLSVRDGSDKFAGSDELWVRSEAALADALEARGLRYDLAPGEAAFYGPKIDIEILDAQGREETLSTVQVDLNMPAQFGLSYVGEDGAEHQPVLVHRSLISTMERMVAHLIEIHGGALPLWLSPVHLALVPVSDRHEEMARDLHRQLLSVDLRPQVLEARQTVGNRIRQATVEKVPYMAVIGDDEVSSGQMSVRRRDGEQLGPWSASELITRLQSEVRARTAGSSLRGS